MQARLWGSINSPVYAQCAVPPELPLKPDVAKAGRRNELTGNTFGPGCTLKLDTRMTLDDRDARAYTYG